MMLFTWHNRHGTFIRNGLLSILFGVLITTLIPTSLYAVDDAFTVRTLIGDDTVPPSVPLGLTASPVATTQIDLTWNASTDNIAVSGYQIFRDSIQIATTTMTAYSDTGLTENTLYSYYITAFDSSDNISATSTTVSTTTLATPVVPPEDPQDGGTSGGIPPPEIVSFEVIPGITSAIIRWRTSGYVRSVVQWGATRSYELGSSAEYSFRQEHEVVLTGLTENTQYFFLIAGENGVGMNRLLAESQFRTLAQPDISPPPNARNFTAIQDGDDIVLDWQNPRIENFSHVRLLRNDRFYPADIADGALVYEGASERVRDIGSAIPGTIQYYTLFTYDKEGRISSGAVVAVTIGEDGVVVPLDPSGFPSAPDQIPLTYQDLVFLQEGVQLEVNNGSVYIDGSRELVVSLPYDVVPEHLKSILVTVYNSATQEAKFSFLLRVNEDKTAYVATLAPFGVSGEFPFSVVIFDYDIRKQADVAGVIISDIQLGHDKGGGLFGVFSGNYLLLFLTTLTALLLLAGWLIRRSLRVGPVAQ